MEGHFPQALTEGQFDLLVCHKEEGDPQFELENLLDPVIYTQSYVPNKNAIIFKLHMYALENTTCSMNLVLVKAQNQQEENQKMMVEMKQRLVFLELFEDDQIVFQAKGMNSGHLVHFKFQLDKKYRLLARYCLIEFPQAQHLQEETSNIFWKLQVISSETVCFVMDTDKEDKEEAIRQTWEQAQPGRAEMAKMNRTRFIAQQKQESQLTEEEKTLTSQTLKERRKLYKQFVQSGQQKETNVKKKEEKKQQGKKQEVVEDEVQETDRQLEGVEIPKSQNHQNQEIKQFIQHIEGPRIQMYPPGTNPKLRTQLEKKSQIETIYIQNEDQYAKMREKNEKRSTRHIKSPSQEQVILSEKQSRKQFEHKISEFKGKRDQYRNKISARTEKADYLTTLLQSEEIDIQELIKAIEQAKQHQCKEIQIKNAEKVLYNLRCNEVSSAIEQNLEESNIEGLQENIKQIEELKLKINKALLEQLNEAILTHQVEQVTIQLKNEIQSGNLESLKQLYDQIDKSIKLKLDEEFLIEIQKKLGKS